MRCEDFCAGSTTFLIEIRDSLLGEEEGVKGEADADAAVSVGPVLDELLGLVDGPGGQDVWVEGELRVPLLDAGGGCVAEGGADAGGHGCCEGVCVCLTMLRRFGLDFKAGRGGG